MKKLLLMFLFLTVGSVYGEELRPQMRVWKSSQLQCGNYSNVLISSTPIIFKTVVGSAAVTQGGDNYFAFFWSTAQPPASDMSTKAFIVTNQSAIERDELGVEWNVTTTTNAPYGRTYSYFSKQGGACPLFYLWDYYQIPPIQATNHYFLKD